MGHLLSADVRYLNTEYKPKIWSVNPVGRQYPIANSQNPSLDRHIESNYSYYMKSLKVARIGNSRGVRIPAGTLKKYGIGEEVIMEERSDGILL
ncbi:MAG: AbrB/MazE/SpoVT family DNA-binding domain-containing protein, partial [Gemmatimonadales bacterium]